MKNRNSSPASTLSRGTGIPASVPSISTPLSELGLPAPSTLPLSPSDSLSQISTLKSELSDSSNSSPASLILPQRTKTPTLSIAPLHPR